MESLITSIESVNIRPAKINLWWDQRHSFGLSQERDPIRVLGPAAPPGPRAEPQSQVMARGPGRASVVRPVAQGCSLSKLPSTAAFSAFFRYYTVHSRMKKTLQNVFINDAT